MEEKTSIAAKLNWLRAGVLGANDGIISTDGVVMGVAATGAALGEIATAGMAAVTAGAVSMALGEYVSVSAQRDTERAMISQHAEEVRDTPDDLEADIVSTLEKRGLNPETARVAAQELAAGDLLHAHLMVHHNVDSKELTNPWAAALSSAVAFLLGSIFPLVAVAVAPAGARGPVILIATVVALCVTGGISAMLSEGSTVRSVTRLVVGGALAMAITYGLGYLFGEVAL